MDISQILQLIIGISILFVWLIRSHVPTNFRVGNASNLREEVLEVGLPSIFYDIMKVIKPMFAFFLIFGLFYAPMTFPSMIVTTILMLGALWMHMKAKDNFVKVIPALTLFVFCILIFIKSA